VIESYVWRNDEPEEPRNLFYKCIVDPARVAQCLDPHAFAFTTGVLVDERKRPIEDQLTDGPLGERLRVHHYYTRSEEECAHKYARGRGSDAVKMRGGKPPFEHLHEKLNQKRDESVLGYAQAVKDRLAEANARAPFEAPHPDVTIDWEGRAAERGPSAVRCIEVAMQAAAAGQDDRRSIDRILDVPAGRGTVMRALSVAYPGARLTACDPDPDALEFCADAYGAEALLLQDDPARIETDALFDLIWCGSLFGDLDPARWPGFLRFFETHLAPWGVLVFTTLGRFHAVNIMGRNRDPGAARELRAAYEGRGLAHAKAEARPGRGTTIASPAWVCGQLEARPGLRLVGYTERGWQRWQDVVACTRIGPRALIAELVAAKPDITEDELIEETGYDRETVSRAISSRHEEDAPPRQPA
jgi:2-polyprenyl-3-methyl-5-hydroxy-6-metoxy-1,4-benzoquinol methylase